MALSGSDFESIYAAIENRVTQQGEYILTSKVIKSDPVNNLIWISECGDQPIPIVGFDYDVKYYDETVQSFPQGAMQLITDVGLASNTFFNVTIPQNFMHLRYYLRAFSNNTGPDDIVMRFNGDGAANYYSNALYTSGASAFAEQLSGEAWIKVGSAPGTSTAQWAYVIGDIPYYSEAGYTYKRMFSENFYFDGTSSWQKRLAGVWFPAGSPAITNIQIYSRTPPYNLQQSSRLTVYGIAPQIAGGSQVVEKRAKISMAVPVVGDLVVVALERGTKRLPRCLGKVQSRNYILTSLDEA